LNTSTACTTSRSPTPELNEDISLMTFEIDSIFNQTLTKENNSLKQKEKTNRSVSIRSNRVKRVLKRYIEKIFYFYIYIIIYFYQIFRLQWCAIITSCSIVLFLWSVIIRYYCLTSSNDDDCNRLSFAWWPFVYCSINGITL